MKCSWILSQKSCININIPNLSFVIVFIDNCMGQTLQSEFKISNSSWLLIQVQMCSPYNPVRKRPFWPHMLTSEEKMRAPSQEWTPRVWGDSISFYKKGKKKTNPIVLNVLTTQLRHQRFLVFFLVLKECQQVHTEAAGAVCTIWGVRRGTGIQAFLDTEDQCCINTQFKEKS